MATNDDKHQGFFARWRQRSRDRAGVSRGLQFNVGVQEVGDPVPAGGEVWNEMPPGTRAATQLETVLIPTPAERTKELIHDETTYYADDLDDPRNPRHAAWEQRHEAEVASGEAAREASEDRAEGGVSGTAGGSGSAPT